MTVKEAHILFDVLLREVNKEIKFNFVEEQKDMFLNMSTRKKISALATEERDRVRNIQTYANIGDYYTGLAPFLNEIELPLSLGGDGRHHYFDLPSPTTSLAVKSLFRNGATYMVANEAAGYDLSNLTELEDEAIIGQTYTIEIPDIVVNSQISTREPISLIKGNIYKIVKAVNFSFRDFGAPSNIAGTIFTCNKNHSFLTYNNIDIRLEVYASKANNLGNPKLEIVPIKSDDYAEVLSIATLVSVKPPFKSGALVKGKRYAIHTEGQTDLTPFGATLSYKNSTFISSKSGEPNWGSAATTLVEVEYRGSELIKPVDLEDKLNHAFGTTVTRPVSTIISNKGRIYHNGNFTPINVLLSYVRVPDVINYKVGGILEFNGINEYDVVQDAARLAAASIVSNNYPTIRAESANQENVKQ